RGLVQVGLDGLRGLGLGLTESGLGGLRRGLGLLSGLGGVNQFLLFFGQFSRSRGALACALALTGFFALAWFRITTLGGLLSRSLFTLALGLGHLVLAGLGLTRLGFALA